MASTCTECDDPVQARGLCSRHYQRHRRRKTLPPLSDTHEGARRFAIVRPPDTDKEPLVENLAPPPWLATSTPIVIVAHPSRRREASTLATQVKAEAISWDNHDHGCEANHRQAWKWLSVGNSRWSVVLEDDVIVAPDFRSQLTQVLALAPAKIISLYLGRGRPPHWQPAIAHAITSLEHDVCWFRSDALTSAQGYAIRTEMLPELLACTQNTGLPIDEQVSRYARARQLYVAYTWPSIVEHREDMAPVIQQRYDGYSRVERRVAWKFGTRPTWDDSVAHLKAPEDIGMKVIWK